MKGFNYENTETKIQKGGKTVRKVSIKRGRGYKSITKYRRGKKVSTVKKPIHRHHIGLIERGIFIPGLFSDCKGCKTKKRRGGNNWDIEMGPKSDSEPVEPYPVPPDPKRFDEFEQRQRELEFARPLSPEVAAAVYAGPNPEEKEVIENKKMGDEDPLNMDPFYREEMKIYSGGKTRRRSRY